ncbi:MAG: hypothetical protein KDA32_03480 [Phycisphaerales bacterium]|nr:hypothetical protein [Phycisphaerales bacterium]
MFQVLLDHDVRFYAVVRDKQIIAQKVLDHNKRKPKYRYHPNHLYDRCVPILFETRLHLSEAYRIVFAKRGASDRTLAFQRGLLEAKRKLQTKRGIDSAAPIEVVASSPKETACLQAVDYFLWGLQRWFERGEARFINLVWDKVGLIIDRDDTRRRASGEYYSRERPFGRDLRDDPPPA